MENNKNRNKKIEEKEAINDNNRIQINEEKNYQYEKTLSELKNMGYINSELILDEKENPQTILIKNEKQELIAIYNDEGIKPLVPEGLALVNQFKELQKEENNLNNSRANNSLEKNKEVLNSNNKNNKNENNKEEENDEKELKNKDAQTEEEFQEELGDEYTVLAIIEDRYVIDRLNPTGEIIGYPLVARDNRTNKFVIMKNSGGKLEKLELGSQAIAGKNVDQYSRTGNIVEDKMINGETFNLPGGEKNDKLEIIGTGGEIQINLILNDKNNQKISSIPVKNSTQMMSTTKELDRIKENGNKIKEVEAILDEMIAKNLIEEGEANTLKREIATNGKPVEEDIAFLRALLEEKESQNANDNTKNGNENENENENENDDWQKTPWDNLRPPVF